MQFLQAANWMRLSLPNMAEVVSPLRVLLERKLKGTTRTGVRHDPERVRGLVEMRSPETVGELMQFLQAANWMRLSLPNMAEVVSPLRVLLERKLKGTTRTSVPHDPERVRGLVEMRCPATVGELMQFLQAANWIRLSLPNMAEVVSPLRVLLERKLKGTTRTCVRHDPERVRGLVEMRSPETVG